MRRNAPGGLLSIALAFAVTTARHQSKLRSVWYDESFTIVWFRSDWRTFWNLARRDSGNGVGYVFALKVIDWAWPGSSVPLGLIESVSIAAWVGLLLVIFACFSRSGHPIWGAITSTAMTFTYIHHQYATELRPYTVGAAVVGALLLLSLEPNIMHEARESSLASFYETFAGLGISDSPGSPDSADAPQIAEGFAVPGEPERVANSRMFILIVGTLLFAAPLIHPLLIPLTAYFTFFFFRRIHSRARWGIAAVGSFSSACIAMLILTNPRGDSQLYWMAPANVKTVWSQLLDWFFNNGVFSILHPLTQAGRLANLLALGLLVWGGCGLPLFGFARTQPRNDRHKNPLTNLFRRAAAPLAVELAFVSLWSALGSHDYLGYSYRYLYMALPLWIVASSCGLLGLLRFASETLARPGRAGDWSGRIFDWLGYSVGAVLFAGAVATTPHTLKQTQRILQVVRSPYPPIVRDDFVADLVQQLQNLPGTPALTAVSIGSVGESNRPAQNIALVGEETAFISMLAARQTGDLVLRSDTRLAQPFHTCSPDENLFEPRRGLGVDLPANFWGTFFGQSSQEREGASQTTAWVIVANNDPCVLIQLQALQGSKTVLTYNSASRSFDIKQLDPP